MFCIRSIVEELPLDAVDEFFVGEFFLLVVDHAKLIGFEFVLLELHGLAHQVAQLDHVAAFRVVLDCLPADLGELVDGLVVDLGEEFARAEGLIADLLDALEDFREFSFVLAEIGFYFLDQLVEEHLHDSEIVLELLHDLVSDIAVDEQFVLFF